ncbi:MAG: hypothetical protein Q7T12_02275 [Flavobacterium sp.]|nr:hypothetical protein [Flavobacterium sp.]
MQERNFKSSGVPNISALFFPQVAAQVKKIILTSVICFRGNFENPAQKKYIFFKFHPLWYKLLSLAAFKGLAQDSWLLRLQCLFLNYLVKKVR